ncbi:hypothetical protein EDC56_0330 [Sinobacterium caligoides]|uniref:Uncharacterized protein n=1 Tax=Sinobacterium caligoides TaxID=933926 RepID=A0A3N2DYH1_9GAMM|nr:hypothetical protein [Sinobacterium caligoides]ROS04817.1 hypothetical protein EDC56_0330 [Sinobacterium caligoides]
MSQFVQHSLSPERLLSVGNNILYKAFLEATRIDSKRLYGGLLEGGTASLVTMRLDDETEVKINLRMYAEDYQGKLNYGSFKKHVSLLIARINERLQSNGPDRMNMRSDARGANHLFNIPAMMKDGDKVNILMFGMSTQTPGKILFTLNYLDPSKQSA